MVDNPILASVRTNRKTGMSHPIRLFIRVLVKDTIVIVFEPGRGAHGVITDEFELA